MLMKPAVSVTKSYKYKLTNVGKIPSSQTIYEYSVEAVKTISYIFSWAILNLNIKLVCY